MSYKVVFDYTGIEDHEWIKPVMQTAYVEVYNEFCSITNNGAIDRLNDEFFTSHPDYKIADDIWSSTEYVEHMQKGYTEIVNSLTPSQIQPMEFYIGDELQLIGRLKLPSNDVEITFHIVEES